MTYTVRWIALAVILTLAAMLVLASAARASDGGPNASRDTNVLALSSIVDVAALAGGDGQVVLAPSRLTARETIVGNVALTVDAPAVARLRGARGIGWRCRLRAGGRRITCRHALTRPRAGTIRPVAVALDAGATGRFGSGALRARLTWRERDGRRWEADSTTERVPLLARRPLTVAAGAVHPRVPDAVFGRPTDAIALQGTVGRRTDEPIRYAWRQLCRRGTPCPRVRWRSAHAGPLGGGQPVASFAPPQVRRAQTLRFALTASDHRGAVSRVVSVRVEPSEIARMAPRFGTTRDAGALLDDAPRAGAPVRIDAGDRARVRVGGVGGTVVRPGGRVRIAGDVLGQAERSVRWGVVRGPRGMLAGVRRDRRTLAFRAPRAEGTYVISMVATTAAGRFERDELVTVDAARAAVRRARKGSARAAGLPAARGAFCALLTRIRSTRGEIEIPLEGGERLNARAASVPPGDGCSGQERIAFTDGRAELGGFRMAELAGRITLDRGAVIESGRLLAPDFWSRAAPANARADTDLRRLDAATTRKAAARSAGTGPSIGFTLPAGDGGVEIGLGVRLGSGGWEDLAGEVVVNRDALSKLPIADSLPGGWSLDSIRLGVNPAARRFELSATAKGPQNTGGDAKIGFEGQLTFDGVVRVQVFAANLAVLQSVAAGPCGGQGTVSAFGELELTPAREYNPSNPSAGAVFPIADVRVTGSLDCYAPTDGMVVKGEVTWDSAEGLSIAGTLTAELPAGRKISADVAGAYKDATNWSLSASLASDEGVRIGDLLTLERLEGSISRNGAGGNSALSVKLTGRVRDIKPALGVTVNEAAATLTNSQCNFAGPLAKSVRARSAATDEHALCLTVDAGLEFRIPGATNPVKVTGGLAIDLRTLRFSVAGSVRSDAPFGPEDFHLTDITLFATNAPSASQACGEATATAAGSGRLSFGFTAKGRILGVALNRVAGAYLADGNYCLAANLGAANLPTSRSNEAIEPVSAPAQPGCSARDAPALQQLVASYSSKDGRASLDGRFCLPRALRERLGTVADGAGEVHLKIATTNKRLTLDGSASYTLPNDGYWLLGAAANSGGASADPTKAALALKSFSVSVKLGASSVGLGFTAAAKLRLPQPTGSFGDAPEAKKPAEANIAIGANASLGDDPSFTVYTTLQGNGGAGCTNDTGDPRVAIPNLFGQAGLNVCALGLSGTLSKTPSVAAAASFALPASWGRDLGVSNASYSLGFSVSASPCVDLSIDRIDTKHPAIDLYNRGAIVANKFHLVIAPTGCTLPSGLNGAGKQITPGFRMDFDGALFGTPVQLSAAITLSGPSFGVEAHLNVGTANRPFKLGPVEFDQTTVDLVVKPAQEQYQFHIDTGARFGSAEFKLKADFAVSGTGTSRTVKLSGSAKIKFELLTAKFDGDMMFSFSSSPAGTDPPTQATIGRFSGHFALDLLVFNVVVDFDTVDYDSTRGGLQVLKVRGGTSTSQSIGSWAQLSANGSVDYTRASNRVHVSMGARVKLWNVIDLQPSLEFNLGPVSIPLRFGPGGEVNWTYPPLNAGIKISGAITATLKWSPNDGFGIDVDSDFRVQACLGACVTLAGVRVDKRTGAMTLTVVGVDIEIRPGVYSGRESAPPSYSGRRGTLASTLGGSNCIYAPSAADQALLTTAACSEHPNGRVFAPAETGELRMRGKCIDAGLDKLNERLRLHTCHGGVNQRWRRDGLGRFISNNGLCIDVLNAQTSPGAVIQVLGCKDHPAQKWAMGGELRPGRTVDACLDTDRGTVQVGTELRLQRCNPNDAYQVWISGTNGSMSTVSRVVGLPFACLGASARRSGERIKFVNCSAPERLLFDGLQNGFLKVQGSNDLCMFSDGDVGSPVTLHSCSTNPDARWALGGYGG